MEREITEVYCGNGKGKTTLAVGQGLRFAAQGRSVIIIQFLKGRERRELDFLEELDNFDFKIFRFEKMDTCYNDLSEQEKARFMARARISSSTLGSASRNVLTLHTFRFVFFIVGRVASFAGFCIIGSR